MIEFENIETGDIKEIALTGRVDGMTAGQIQKAFDELADSGARVFAANLAGVNYVSSAGLRVFLQTQKSLKSSGGELILCGLTPPIFEIFKMGGFQKIFNIVKSLSDYQSDVIDSSTSIDKREYTLDNIKYEIIEKSEKKGVFQMIGSTEKLAASTYEKSDMKIIKPSEIRFGAGLAAIGGDWGNAKNYFGESVVIQRSLFSYPAIKSPAVDYMIYSGDGPGIDYGFLHGFGFSGEFKYIARFESLDRFPSFEDIINKIAENLKIKSFGIVFIGESKGFWGMNLRRIPITENKPENSESILSDENFANWMNFPVEPGEFNNAICGCGIYSSTPDESDLSKALSSDSDYHIHATVFKKALLDMETVKFEQELNRVIAEFEPIKTQHMLGKSLFNRGVIGIIEL